MICSESTVAQCGSTQHIISCSFTLAFVRIGCFYLSEREEKKRWKISHSVGSRCCNLRHLPLSFSVPVGTRLPFGYFANWLSDAENCGNRSVSHYIINIKRITWNMYLLYRHFPIFKTPLLLCVPSVCLGIHTFIASKYGALAKKKHTGQ